MTATPMTGGEALVRSLYNEGMRVVFGLPGVFRLPGGFGPPATAASRVRVGRAGAVTRTTQPRRPNRKKRSTLPANQRGHCLPAGLEVQDTRVLTHRTATNQRVCSTGQPATTD